MQIFIRAERTHTIDVAPNDSIDSMINAFEAKSGISGMRFIFAGKQLTSGLSLADYGIQKDATVHATAGLNGGAGGALINLVAYGSQDVYLTSNPTVTYWKAVVRRHTPAALEMIVQTSNGTTNFGQRVTVVVSRNGDLMTDIMLQINLPTLTNTASYGTTGYLSWVKGIAHALVQTADLDIGGQRIDRITGQFLDMMQELTVKEDKQAGLDRMVGRNWDGLDPNTGIPSGSAGSGNPGTLYLPLLFWFSNTPSLSLPLIALQYHEVKLTIQFAPLDGLIRVFQDAVAGTASPVQPYLPARWARPTTVPTLGALQCDVYVTYCFLDADERRKFATVSHEMLITQCQFTGTEAIAVPSNSAQYKQRLNLNHPCKFLMWVCPHDNMDTARNIISNDNTKYKTFIESTTSTDMAIVSMPVLSLDYFNYDEYAGYQATKCSYDTNAKTNLRQSPFRFYTTADPTVGLVKLSEAAPGNNPVATARITMNGHDRMSDSPGTYFQYVQPYMHFPRVPKKPIMVYSFALSPADPAPSGTANFSRIDTAQLVLSFVATHQNTSVLGSPSSASAATFTRLISIYAVNYNVLRVVSGMAGLAFSN